MGIRKILGSVCSFMLCGALSVPYCSASENYDLKNMDLEDGSIWLIGDIDASGTIDVSDLTLLSLYLIGDTELKDGQKISADANSDGAIDMCDLANLGRYISKGDRVDVTVVIGETRIIKKNGIDRPERSVPSSDPTVEPSPITDPDVPASPTPIPTQVSGPPDRGPMPEVWPVNREDNAYDHATLSGKCYSKRCVHIFDEAVLDEKTVLPFFIENSGGGVAVAKTVTGTDSSTMFLLKCGLTEGKYYVFINDDLSEEEVKHLLEKFGITDFIVPEKKNVTIDAGQPIPTVTSTSEA